VVTDVGSVKGPVLDRWGGWPRFVASHPMAGTAQAGVEAGLTGLFAGRPWVATPSDDTDPEALAVVRGLAEAVDARWIECPAADHDQAVALISHLPVLLGAALIEAAGPVPLARLLASSGFADTSRVGGGNPELGSLMARYNREALLAALARYRTSLDGLEQQVRAGDWPGLEQCLSQAQALRPEFL
jgi:arogenate dehydrogenase (NADP+)